MPPPPPPLPLPTPLGSINKQTSAHDIMIYEMTSYVRTYVRVNAITIMVSRVTGTRLIMAVLVEICQNLNVLSKYY